MKRNMDLVREILLAMEQSDEERRPFSVDGYDQDIVNEHIRLMKEHGLIDAILIDNRGGLAEAIPQRIRWPGHEFLDATRSNAVWNRAKAAGAVLGTFSIETVKALAIRIGTEMAMKSIGS